MKNSARGDSSTGSELKAVEEACREASRTVEPCTTITQFLRSSRKFCVDLECSNTGIDSRQGAKYAKFRNRKIDNFYKPSYSFFPTFAALASLREIFRVSVAALPRWELCVSAVK